MRIGILFVKQNQMDILGSKIELRTYMYISTSYIIPTYGKGIRFCFLKDCSMKTQSLLT